MAIKPAPMDGGLLAYGLLAALAIALLFAAITDIRARIIDNWLTIGIAAAAPLFWWASGLGLWPGVGLQLAVAAVTFVILTGAFAIGWMGGGDVKLLTALALWLPWPVFTQLMVWTALIGCALTIIFGCWHIAARRVGRPQIPYGIAIASAGLWVLFSTYWPAASQFAGTRF